MLSRPRRLAVSIVVILAVIALASRAFLAKDGDQARYRTEAASRGEIVADVTATGTVNPVTSVQVGTYVSGPIQAIDADFNASVRKGQRVAKIDPRPFELRVQQAEATVANARAKLAKSHADLSYKTTNLARLRKLRAEGIVAEDEVDTNASSVDQARADVALQAAEVQQAEAQLAEARVNLGYTDIISPVDGVVVSRNVDVGQTVAASFQTPTLFLIAEDLTKMQVNANVSESDIGVIRDGQPATFTVDAYPERTFTGQVIQVRNAPQNVQNVITYDVVIGADNRDLALRPGMTANITVETGRRDDALRVPTAALRFRPRAADGSTDVSAVPAGGAGGTRSDTAPSARVFVLRDGQPSSVAIETGLADESYTEVKSGAVVVGDPIVIAAERSAKEAEPSRVQPPGFSAGGPRRGR